MANYNAPAFETVVEMLKGRKGLRTAKPKDGFAAYVWRMVRFHSGIDMRMPVTCEFDLSIWADHSYVNGDKEAYKALRNIADKYADDACKVFGLDNMVAAKRWHRAMYG